MGNKILDTVKSDAIEAGYRVAATQATNAVKAGLVKALQSKGGDSQQIAMLTVLLDSEIGQSLISLAMGYGLTYMPPLKSNQRAQRLAEEMRINGISEAGNLVTEVLFSELMPIISSALAKIPDEEAEGLRVISRPASTEEVEQAEDAPVKVKKVSSINRK